MTGLMIVIALVSWIGMMLYAKYFDCDPVKADVRFRGLIIGSNECNKL